MSLNGHEGEIVSLSFSAEGDKIVTGSFDHTARIWDVNSGKCIRVLDDHQGEISSTQFEFSGEFVATGSVDRTCKIWDVGSGQVF